MKNLYTFKKLNRATVDTFIDEAALFFAMHDFIGSSGRSTYLDSFEEVEMLLNKEVYYVAHDVIVRRGKALLFRGRLVASEKSNLISYLKDAISQDDLRPLLIAPVFDTSPDQVIYLADDGFHVYPATH